MPSLDLRGVAAGPRVLRRTLVGLTATPTKQTFGFFRQNLIMEYTHELAVADGVNVDFTVYIIKTAITERWVEDRDGRLGGLSRPDDPEGSLGGGRRAGRVHVQATRP